MQITFDYNTLFPKSDSSDEQSSVQKWDALRDEFQSFIASRAVRGEEATGLFEKLLAAKGGNDEMKILYNKFIF